MRIQEILHSPAMWYKGHFTNNDNTKMCLSFALAHQIRNVLPQKERMDTFLRIHDKEHSWYESKQLELMQQVIKELFPERFNKVCWSCNISGFNGCCGIDSPINEIVAFNDHRDTTWDDLQKVMQEYEYRLEAIDLH